MRWGQKRGSGLSYFKVTGFLWLPKHRMSGWRWLEEATWWKFRQTWPEAAWDASLEEYADWVD